MPFAFPGQFMPNHPGRRARKLALSHGYAPPTGGGVPASIVVNGITYQLLDGADGQYLTGADAQPLYGSA